MPYPTRLLWTDFETDGLPDGMDYSVINILEVAVIVTDFDLEPQVGYSEVLKMTPAAAERIRANDYVKQMHGKSGLLRDSVNATHTVAQVEAEILDLLDQEQYMIAGSGVAAFDHPLIKTQMPRLAQRLAYYPFDVGVMRRTAKILAGKEIVNPTLASYGETKAHRALADVKAHILEARTFQTYFRER